MKTLIFKRENNDFSDILNDVVIKKKITTKITWHRYLMVQFEEDNKLLSYVILKYGDEIIPMYNIIKDFTPVRGKDYDTYRDKNYKPTLSTEE